MSVGVSETAAHAPDQSQDQPHHQPHDEGRDLLIVSSRPFISATFAEQANAKGLTTEVLGLDEEPPEPDDSALDRYAWVVVDVCGDPTAAVQRCTSLASASAHLVLLITCERSVSSADLAQLLKCRPSGVLGAGLAPDELVWSLEMIQGGHMIVHLDRSGETGKFLQLLLVRGAQTAKVPTLSRQERDLLGMIAQGMSDAEIAARLYVSEATVRRRVSSLRKRTTTSRRSELAAWAGAHGYYETTLARSTG